MNDDGEFTALLQRCSGGDPRAEAILLRATFSTLLAMAGARLRRFASSTLCPGELVSEAYLRLRPADVEWTGAEHFFRTVGQVMRNVIVDHGRARHCEKRGGGAAHVLLETLEHLADGTDLDVALDCDALRARIAELRRVDRRQARVAELKILCGLTNAEIARSMEISLPSVVRLWRAALARLTAADTAARSPCAA